MDDFRFEELRSKINPQSGTDGATDVVDIVTEVVDGAVIEDICSVERSVAGRPQPPPAITIADFMCALCITIRCSLTLSGTV